MRQRRVPAGLPALDPLPFLVLLTALAGLPGVADPLGAQVTPQEGRTYPLTSFGGTCFSKRTTNTGRVGAVHGSTFMSTQYRRGGHRVGHVSPPGCIAVELGPGEYERVTRGLVIRKRNYCVYSNQPPDACTEVDSEEIQRQAIEQGPFRFQVSVDCRSFAGTAGFVRGDVRDGSGRPIREGDRVDFGDEIRTGDGQIEIRSETGALRVAPNSTLRSSEWDCAPEAPERTTSVTLVLGRIWTWVTGGEATVGTATAVNGVRGTTFLVEAAEVDGEPLTTTWVLEGEVEVWSRLDPDSTVLVGPGRMTRVVGFHPPAAPEPFDRAELEALAEEDGASLPPPR